MKFHGAYLIAFFVLTLPSVAFASVVLSEIAWMGTKDSSTNEWVELLNTGETQVDLSGWTLVAEDGKPNIQLSGSIVSGGYYLIERSDDGTVPGVKADLVASFGNGISNHGETLYLKDASGNIVDTVVGGTNWINSGGDNETKETAQRLLGDGGGWITAPATPRAPNQSKSKVKSNVGTSSTLFDTSPTTASQKAIVKKSHLPRELSLPKKNKRENTVRDQAQGFDSSSTENVGGVILWDGGKSAKSESTSSEFAKWWMLGAGILLFGFAALIVFRKSEEAQLVNEYAIIEEIEGAEDL